MDTAEFYMSGSGIISIYSCSSPNDNNPNEDQAAIYPVNDESIVLIVADGAGGHTNAVAASLKVISEIRNAISSSRKSKSELREAILTGIENANNAILTETAGAASTVAVAEIQGNWIRTYHAGDTEILITGLRGKIKHQTVIHSPVGYAIEAGLLDEDQAIMHKDRHIVSNILGFESLNITISTLTKLAKYDTLLIATDGLFDNLQKDEIVEIIRKGTLEKCSNNLISKVYQRMDNLDKDKPSKFDDMSFILFRLCG